MNTKPLVVWNMTNWFINENSNVLLFGCEGDADKDLYQKLLTE